MEDLRGLDLFLGLDLSSTSDLTAMAALGRVGPKRWRLRMRFWCPADCLAELERQTRMPYRLWADEGWLVPTAGAAVDYEWIRKEVKDAAALGKLRKILSDPWNAQDLGQQLKDRDGLPLDFIRQGYADINAPTKEFRRRITAREIEHDGNPIMRWNILNAVAETNSDESVRLSKKQSREKIDGASAAINATAATIGDAAKTGVYNTRGPILI